jgi:POT family proton-dependent oligopeptide transporter
MADRTEPGDLQGVVAGFLGHPSALAWLSGAEFWERFSYYGMQALLVLYLTHVLLLPGHVEHVLGFGYFRHALESVIGPLSPQALASAIFGLYAGLVYVMPILGGLVADLWLGRTLTVILGASLMAIGHLLMAFETSLLPALACLLLGCGAFKGNLAAQVGELYPEGDGRRSDAFQIYYIAINAAIILSPLICGTLGERIAFHWGFGAAGIGMLVGLATYLLGLPSLPKSTRTNAARSGNSRLSAGDRRNLVSLLLLLLPLGLVLTANFQIFNAYLLWGEMTYRLQLASLAIPVTWLLSLSCLISVISLIWTVGFWRWYRRRWAEPDELTKAAVGGVLLTIAPLILMMASWVAQSSGRRISLGWALLFECINDTGFANVAPVSLALFSRLAPRKIEGMMMSIYYLVYFIANALAGWLGTYFERVSAPRFWMYHAFVVGVATLVLAGARRYASVSSRGPQSLSSAA